MKIIIIFCYYNTIYIALQSFFQRFFNVLSTHRLPFIFLSKDFFLNLKSWFFCFKHHCDKRFTFMILFKYILRIRQTIYKNLIILAKRKFFSTYEIIKFSSILFIFQNVFHFIFFVFVHENYFRQNDNMCIYIIWL